MTPAYTFQTFCDTCRHLPDLTCKSVVVSVCVCVCVFPCASTKLPDTCRHLLKSFVTPADTCRGRC